MLSDVVTELAGVPFPTHVLSTGGGPSSEAVAIAATASAEAATAAAAAATAAASAASAAAAAMSTTGSVAATTPGSVAATPLRAIPFASVHRLAPVVTPPRPGPFLNPKQHKTVVLKEKINVSHDSCIFRFALDHPNQLLGLPVGQHLFVKKTGMTGKGKEELVMRAYTPTTGNETPGHFDLLVKIYRPNVDPRFPDGGKLSTVRLDSFSWILRNSVQCFHHSAGGCTPVHPKLEVK